MSRDRYQIFDMGNFEIVSYSIDAWESVKPDYLPDDKLKECQNRFWNFVNNANSGDCFVVNMSVYVVKLGKDWNE